MKLQSVIVSSFLLVVSTSFALGQLAYPGFPYESNFATLSDGTQLHYLDEGEGDPFVLLHGNPTSSYLWRNVIPHLAEDHRVIAVDLPNFGKSDRTEPMTLPELTSAFTDFVDVLELENITYGLHDWGGPIGMLHAARNPDNVRGIAFFETPLFPIPSFAPFVPAFGEEITDADAWFARVREENNLVEGSLLNPANGFLANEPSEATKAVYRSESESLASRDQFALMAYEIPIADATGHPLLDPDGPGGAPAEPHPNVALFDEFTSYLATSVNTPKLMIAGTPGVVNPPPTIPLTQQLVSNLDVIELGSQESPALHYLQEDFPDRIGVALNGFSTQISVPEPSSAWLAAFGMLVACRRFRERTRYERGNSKAA